LLGEVLDGIRAMGERIGRSSLQFELHGDRLALSKMLTHFGPLLPPVVLSWDPSGEVTFDLIISVTPDPQSRATAIDMDLRFTDVGFSSLDFATTGDHIEGSFHINLTIPETFNQPAMIRGDIRLENGEIHLDRFRFDFKRDPLQVQLLATYDLQRDRLAPLSIQFQTPILGEGRIEAVIESLTDVHGKADLEVGPILNEQALERFVREPFAHVVPALKDVSIHGKTQITASIRGSTTGYEIQGFLHTSAMNLTVPPYDLEASGLDVRLPFTLESSTGKKAPPSIVSNTSIDGLVKAEKIRWRSYELRDMAVAVAFAQGTLLVGGLTVPILGGTVAVERAEIRNLLQETREITLGLSLDRLDLSELSRRLFPSGVSIIPPGHLRGKFTDIAISQGKLVTRGSLTIDLLGGQIEISNIHIPPPLSELRRASMDVLVQGISLEEASLRDALPAAILNWKLSAAMALDFSVEKGVAGTAVYTGVNTAVRLKSGAFSSPDQTTLAENLQGNIDFGFNIPLKKERPLSFRGDLKLEGGEVLLASFYLNLSQDPIYLRSQGAYDSKNSRLPSLTIQIEAPTLGRGAIKATIHDLEDRRGEVDISLGPIANERVFELFVKEPFGHLSPVLKDISINGETRIQAKLHGAPARYSIQGQFETSVSDLMIPTHDIKATGVKIQLPISLDHPEADKDPFGVLTGFLKGEWIRWKSLEWQDLTVPLTLQGNILSVPRSIELPIWKGSLFLKDVRIRNPFRKTAEITMGLRLTDLDLSKLTGKTLPFALAGTVESDFSEIRVSHERLVTQGALTIHTLGGTIKTTNINGSAPFSRLRKTSMDVLLNDIHLEEASRSLKFGRMGGVIEGEVKDLTFSFGQPERFEVEIHSIRKKGVRQYINAEAVNNLAILSTGAGYAFGRSLLQLLENFPYSKLGIYCKLENDVFTLRGTIHEKGVEYLIRKGILRGIDVVNQNPENRIRWRQMLRRLKAIGQGGGEIRVSTQK
jgi:hypothetical protein